MLENHMVTGLQYEEAYPDVEDCEHCSSTGIDPLSYDESKCYVCDGKGEIVAPARHGRVLIKKKVTKSIKKGATK